MVTQEEVFKDSPLGSKSIEACLLGAPNAGKSSLMNCMVEQNISAVSDKFNTTDDPVKGILTNWDKRT